MSDEVDVTNARTEIETDIIRKYYETRKAVRSDDCVECGTTIPESRQQATGGCNTCINCQSEYEHRNKFSTHR